MSVDPQTIPGGALAAVRMARRCLSDAQFRLDDAGLACDPLDRLQASTALLLSAWTGRTRLPVPEPDYVIEAAREWRRQNGRSY